MNEFISKVNIVQPRLDCGGYRTLALLSGGLTMTHHHVCYHMSGISLLTERIES